MSRNTIHLLFWIIIGSQANDLRVLVPLYARPSSFFWEHMVSSSYNTTVNYSVVINPNSGPGEYSEEEYTNGMIDLKKAGVEVLCYVPTGFGVTDVDDVCSDIDSYEDFYPGLCEGYFFDEGPGTENNTWKYTEYYDHAQFVSGSSTTVVVNPGITPHQSLYDIGDRFDSNHPGMGGQVVVTSFENRFEVFYDGTRQLSIENIPFPPRYIRDRYMHSMMVYDAFFSEIKEFLDWTVFQLFCSNWGYVFFTDDSFGSDGNPWDRVPSYFVSLLESVEKASNMGDECGTWSPTPSPTMAPSIVPTSSPIQDEDSVSCSSKIKGNYNIYVVVLLCLIEVLLFC